MPSVLQIIGLCSRANPEPPVPVDTSNLNTTSTFYRNFELRTTVYDRPVGQSAHPTSFSVHCYYPKQGRFASTPVPDRGTLIGVCGEIIGQHQHTNNLCLLLQELIFLSTRGNRPQQSIKSENTSSTTISEASNTLPSRKRKWSQWGRSLKHQNASKDSESDLLGNRFYPNLCLL